MDRTLEQAVLCALYLEQRIDASRIVARVHEGVVTLIGEVDTNAEKQLAKHKAASVAGVNEVCDELEVRASRASETGAGDIATNVVNALFWDLAVPRDRVCAKCEKGWVTLTGEVDRAYQRSSAEADVRKIRGVVGVTNEIRIIAVRGPAKAEAERASGKASPAAPPPGDLNMGKEPRASAS